MYLTEQIQQITILPLCSHCHPQCSVRAEEDDTCHLQGRVECGQSAGRQHMHQCSCDIRREDRASGGNSCAA